MLAAFLVVQLWEKTLNQYCFGLFIDVLRGFITNILQSNIVYLWVVFL